MEPTKAIIVVAVGLVVLWSSTPAFATESTDTYVVSSTVKAEADRILEDEILPTLRVEAHDPSGGASQASSSQAVRIQTTRYIGLDSFLEADTPSSYIQFSGTQVAPETVVTIIFSTNPIRSSTMANAQGEWSVNVPIDQLAPGRHTAMLQTIYQGVRSEEVTVAEFQVEAEETLSNSTWVFLFSSVLAILCLLFAITLQLHHNMRGFSTDPLV